VSSNVIHPLLLRVDRETWPLTTPFHITGHTFEALEVVKVSLDCRGVVGQGEAAGVYYLNDLVTTMVAQLETVRSTVEAGIDRDTLQRLLPAGGARNALDCAFWDLEAKLQQQSVWQLAGLNAPGPLLTTFGCGADTPENMAAAACRYPGARAIKLKLTGESVDAERVKAVRSALPDVWLGVDANQGFTPDFLDRLMPVLVDERVALIEQPFPVSQNKRLEGLRSPIPVAADESAQTLQDLPQLVGRFDVVNIKLDKCGGLTHGLAMARRAHELEMKSMVGNMIGTSLAMAPAILVGQLCQVVDLDGPLFLKTDRPIAAQYSGGFLRCSEAIWGSPVGTG